MGGGAGGVRLRVDAGRELRRSFAILGAELDAAVADGRVPPARRSHYEAGCATPDAAFTGPEEDCPDQMSGRAWRPAWAGGQERVGVVRAVLVFGFR